MKSRLAVSVLFILIAATLAPDVTAAFERLRWWTGKVWGRCVVQACHRVTSRNSARMSAVKGGDKYRVTMVHVDGLPLSPNFPTENQPGVVGTTSPDGTTITSSSRGSTELLSLHKGHPRSFFKFIGSAYHSESFEFITTAAKQLH